MKLRIRGNSIRLRLTKSEVAKFAETGHVADVIEFHVGHLTYALVADEAAKSVWANFRNGRIAVTVPETIADEWTQTERVGFSAEQTWFEDKTLRIVIEKDFVCLTAREGEDESNGCPHPTNCCD